MIPVVTWGNIVEWCGFSFMVGIVIGFLLAAVVLAYLEKKERTK